MHTQGLRCLQVVLHVRMCHSFLRIINLYSIRLFIRHSIRARTQSRWWNRYILAGTDRCLSEGSNTHCIQKSMTKVSRADELHAEGAPDL